MRRLALAATILGALWSAASAQELQRIAAIVNEDVISMYDLNARTELIVVTSRLPDTQEVRRRIQPQILRAMIDERLELQEAKRRNVSVTQADIQRAVSSIEADNNLPSGGLKQFLTDAGLSMDSLTDQIRASVAWQKVVSRQFRAGISITPEQIDEALAAIQKKQGQEEIRLGEILLTVDSPDEENTVRDNARRLVEQIRGGARFDSLARQFSQASSAPDGGDRGWITIDDSEPALAAALRQLPPNQVSDPIRTIAGYNIVVVRDRRRAAAGATGDAKVSLNQVFLPSGSETERRAQLQLAGQIRETLSGCADMEKAAREVRSPRPAHLGDYQMKDLAPQLRDVIAPLKVGQASQPLPMADGVLLVMVCARDEPKTNLPDREQVETMLMNERLGMLARRHLRDLRLGSIVDLRI
jgi:peptidyl-prolyl cis-trans isomerase SurA